MQTTIFNVSGINDTNSAVTIRNAITSVEGVTNVSIDKDFSKVTITFDPTFVDLSKIESKIIDSGFNIH